MQPLTGGDICGGTPDHLAQAPHLGPLCNCSDGNLVTWRNPVAGDNLEIGKRLPGLKAIHSNGDLVILVHM